MPETGVKSGLLLVVLGLWVILRTVSHDSTPTPGHPHGRTLIDHILGSTSGSTSSTLPPPQSPNPIGPLPAPSTVPAPATGGPRPLGPANPFSNPFAPLLPSIHAPGSTVRLPNRGAR